MSNDSIDPLHALVAQHPENAEAYNPFSNFFNPNSPNQPNNENQSDEEEQITLSVRQPSFSSLQGDRLVTKSGQNVTDLPQVDEEDPVIVLEDDNKDGVQQSISYHPSSYSSIGNHHPDLAKELPSIKPPKTIPIEEVLCEEDEEEDCPEVQIVKELKQKNESRWKKMGFEPPENLIELTREASRSKLNPINSSPKQQTPAFEGIAEEEPNPQIQANDSNTNTPQGTQIRLKHQRCGSNGMQLGEASTGLLKMSQALMIPEKEPQANNLPETVEEYQIDDEFDLNEEEEEEFQNEEDFQNEEEEEAYSNIQNNYSTDKESYATDKESYIIDRNDLFGRLNLIVNSPKSSTIYKILLKNSSSGVPRSEHSNIRRSLKEISDKCVENIWIDETAYVNRLIDLLGTSNSPKKSPKKHSKEVNTVQNLRERYKEAQQKYTNLIDSENIKYKNRIDHLMQEYHKKAAELDSKYQSSEMINKFNTPSPQLLAMRENVKNLLRTNQIDQARNENLYVIEQEKREVKDNSRKLREKYYAADRKLKELYAGKREILNMKHRLAIQSLESSKSRSKKKYDKLITNAKEDKTQVSYVSSADLENATPLPVKQPKSLNRNRDDKLIEAMSLEIEKGNDVSKIDIDALFKKSSSNTPTSSKSTSRRSKH